MNLKAIKNLKNSNELLYEFYSAITRSFLQFFLKVFKIINYNLKFILFPYLSFMKIENFLTQI